MHYFDEYPEYVPVAKRRAKAEKKLKLLRKQKPDIQPIRIEGRALAKTWWGKSWNSNLERYADFDYRLERGRSYVRHGSVLDLQLAPERITALVLGSQPQPYEVVINVDKLKARQWASIRNACQGHVDSLSELLAGRFPQALKDLFYEQGAGLFPSPKDIHFACTCPDSASMCKHVAATLYGVGARLDEDAGLFFTLRGIPIGDVIAETVTDTTRTLLRKAEQQSTNILDDAELSEVFGIQLDDLTPSVPDLPRGKPKVAAPKKTARKPSKPRRQSPAATPPKATMLEALVKAIGKTRRGKSTQQLQAKLGWTTVQVRNAVTRASAKGLIEPVTPGMYRQKG